MRTLISFLTALVVVISAHAQDSDNRTMLNVAQAKIGNSKATTVKQVAGNDKVALFEKDGGGFAIVKSDGKHHRVIAYSDSERLDLSGNNPGFNWWMNAVSHAPSIKSTTPPDPARFPTRLSHSSPLCGANMSRSITWNHSRLGSTDEL